MGNDQVVDADIDTQQVHPLQCKTHEACNDADCSCDIPMMPEPQYVTRNAPVEPADVYQPNGLYTTTMFKRWALRCGKCGKDFHQFRVFLGRGPRCPYCRTVNKIDIQVYQ